MAEVFCAVAHFFFRVGIDISWRFVFRALLKYLFWLEFLPSGKLLKILPKALDRAVLEAFGTLQISIDWIAHGSFGIVRVGQSKVAAFT